MLKEERNEEVANIKILMGFQFKAVNTQPMVTMTDTAFPRAVLVLTSRYQNSEDVEKRSQTAPEE